MSTPEPVDEARSAPVEVRGGDKPEDYVPALLNLGEYIVPGDIRACGHFGADCDCGDE